MLLALTATVVLAPLLYAPGYLIALALLGAAQPPDRLERHYERVVAGTLLNGWLALVLAECGVFSAGLHLALVALVCAGCGWVAWRRGVLRLPGMQLGIALRRPAQARPAAWLADWETIAFLAIGLAFALLVVQPYEVVLGARDAGVYATTGLAIARNGSIVQRDALLRQLGQDQSADDPQLRAAAAQAQTNFLGTQPASRFVATRMRFVGYLINAGDLSRGLVTPQFLHLYPTWIGLLASLLGQRGGMLATGLLGLLGLWGVGMLGRRLAGRWAGLLGMLFLALNGVQIWFSRYSTSEACAQFLIFAALYGFALMHDRRPTPGDRTYAELNTQHSTLNTHSWFGGLLAGVAAGQLALTRIDFFVLVAPLLVYVLYAALTRRWSGAHMALSGGLGAMLLHAALHGVFISRAYFLDTLYARLQDQSAIVAWIAYALWTPALRQQFLDIPRAAAVRSPLRLAIEIVLVLVLVAGFIILRRDGRPQRWLERAALRFRAPLLWLGAASILLLGGYAYLIRPQIVTVERLAAAPSCVLPGPAHGSADCLALQGYVGAPIAPAEHPNALIYALSTLPKRVRGIAVPPYTDAAFSPGNPGESEKIGIAQANLVRVGWYLSPLGVLLGIAGFALWWRRGMNAASWLFLAASLISAVFFVRLSYGASDLTYIYILRRYMPLVYPAFSLGMAYAIVALARRPTTDDRRPANEERGWRAVFGGRRSVVLSISLVLAQLAFFVVTNRQLYAHVEYRGALEQLGALAQNFTPDDVLLFRGEGRDTPDLVTTPLQYGFGLNAFTIRSSDPGRYAQQLARYVQRWRDQGRQVFLVLGANGAVELPGLRPVRVGPASLRLPEFQQLRDQKPSLSQQLSFDFVIYRLESAAATQPPIAVAVDDYAAQARGFYHAEQIDGTSVAWTGGDALVRLPWPRDNAPFELVVNLAPGLARPAALGPARACLSYRPESSLALGDAPFAGEQCFELGAGMAGYRYRVEPRGQPPATGTFLLRIASPTWVPAAADPAQHDGRALGVQFGGVRLER